MRDRNCADDESGMPLPLRPTRILREFPREERSRGSKVEKIVRLLVKTTFEQSHRLISSTMPTRGLRKSR